MELFSRREGLKPIKSITQVDYMDSELRNGLWNALYSHYWSRMRNETFLSHDDGIELLVSRIWCDYFKLPVDTIDNHWTSVYDEIRSYFFNCPWYEVYDFVEFVANSYYQTSANEDFIEECNEILKRELSGYRFIGGEITPITAEEEIAEIKEALQSKTPLEPVIIHLQSALELFSDRKSPDYRNSIKESISAVEAICNLIAGKDKATLGEALKRIIDKVELHPALQKSFSNLYGYTSDADGIRHSLLDEPNLDFEDAKFMLVSCSAFINYLKVKASKAGVDLETR